MTEKKTRGDMRTVLITGGSRGLGAAMVRRFAEAGDRVFFTWKEANQAADALACETGAEALHADVTDGEQVRRTAAEVIEKAGAVDVLICNAGTDGQHGMTADIGDEEYHRIMDTNVFGTFAFIREILPGMFWRRKGSILTVASIWGQTGGSCEAVYSASKAAVIGLTKAIAKETAGAGIRVNCLAPGMMDTDMNARLSAEEKEDLLQEIPLGRMGTPDEAAEAAYFLTGEGAAYVTGQVFGLNGGWLI